MRSAYRRLRVSEPMKRALVRLREAEAAAKERGEEWGIKPSSVPARTVWALEAAGLVEVETRVSERSDLRKGSFGRWLGGTRRWTEVTLLVKVREAK